MTLFSSRPPFRAEGAKDASVRNDDPEPMIYPYSGQRAAVADETLGWRYHPRPEYNRPQHNPTNPILTEFRKLHEETGNDLWTDAYLSWSDLIEQDWGGRDEYWHAFSVLAKIVALGKVN